VIWVSVGRLTTIKSLAFMPGYDGTFHWPCLEQNQTINEQKFRLRVTKPWNLPPGRRHVRWLLRYRQARVSLVPRPMAPRLGTSLDSRTVRRRPCQPVRASSPHRCRVQGENPSRLAPVIPRGARGASETSVKATPHATHATEGLDAAPPGARQTGKGGPMSAYR
jgi:hypothetical protein